MASLSAAARNKKKKYSGSNDRRRWARVPVEYLTDVTTQLTSGGQTWLVDLSRGGARLRTRTRMLPGLKTTVKFTTPDGPSAVKGQIVRSSLVNFPDGPPGYEIGISFDEPLAGAIAAAMDRAEARIKQLAAARRSQETPEAANEVESLIDNLKE